MAGGFIWRGAEFRRKLVAHLERNLTGAAIVLQRELRKMHVGSGIANATRKEREANRSKPWSPPHVQTGFLKNNINYDRPRSLTRRVGTGVGTAQSVGYGVWLEFGTRRMMPRPWFRPGIHKATPAMRAAISRPMKGNAT